MFKTELNIQRQVSGPHVVNFIEYFKVKIPDDIQKLHSPAPFIRATEKGFDSDKDSLFHKKAAKDMKGLTDDSFDVYLTLMELCRGLTLEDFILSRKKPLPLPWIRFIVERVLLAVQHLHDKFIIHADIKSANVLITL